MTDHTTNQHYDANQQWEAKLLGNLLQEPVKPLPSASPVNGTQQPVPSVSSSSNVSATTLGSSGAPQTTPKLLSISPSENHYGGQVRRKFSKWKPWTWFRRGEKDSVFDQYMLHSALPDSGREVRADIHSRSSPSLHVGGDSRKVQQRNVVSSGANSTAIPSSSFDTISDGGSGTGEKRRSGLPIVSLEPLTPDQVEALHPDVKAKRKEILDSERKIHFSLEELEKARNKYLSTRDMNREEYCGKELESVVKCMKRANHSSLERIRAFKAAQAQQLVTAGETPASEVVFARNINSLNGKPLTSASSSRARSQDAWLPAHASLAGAGSEAGVMTGDVLHYRSSTSSSPSTSTLQLGGVNPQATSSTHARGEFESSVRAGNTPLFTWWENTPVIALDALECRHTVDALQVCTREVLGRYTKQDQKS